MSGWKQDVTYRCTQCFSCYNLAKTIFCAKQIAITRQCIWKHQIDVCFGLDQRLNLFLLFCLYGGSSTIIFNLVSYEFLYLLLLKILLREKKKGAQLMH